jgi:hypothetical protein
MGEARTLSTVNNKNKPILNNYQCGTGHIRGFKEYKYVIVFTCRNAHLHEETWSNMPVPARKRPMTRR